jgi:hypothetical protein
MKWLTFSYRYEADSYRYDMSGGYSCQKNRDAACLIGKSFGNPSVFRAQIPPKRTLKKDLHAARVLWRRAQRRLLVDARSRIHRATAGARIDPRYEDSSLALSHT